MLQGVRYEKCWFNTVTVYQLMPMAEWFYKLQPQSNSTYRLHQKQLPSAEILEEWLTPRALAYWYMDDGSLRSDVNAVIFSTESFTKQEVDLLCQVLEKTFRLQTSRHVKGKHFRIYVSTTFYRKFYVLVSPYLIPSMRRKLRVLVETEKP